MKNLDTFQKYLVEEFYDPSVNHTFHNDTGQRYVEEQATQAWLDTLAWFEEYVRQG